MIIKNMYGLLKSDYAEFAPREKAFYSSYYCRICYCLRNLIGQIGGVFVDYDLVFYSILVQLVVGEKAPESYKCHYFRGKERLNFLSDHWGTQLAVFSMAVFKCKFNDDIEDENSLKAKLALKAFRNKFKLVRKSHGNLFDALYAILSKFSDYETSEIPIDEILEDYGKIVVEMFLAVCDDIPDNYRQIIKAMAKWEYFMDMLLDYKDDYKKGTFNPLIDIRYKTLQDFIADSSNYIKIYDYYEKLIAEVDNAVIPIKSDRIEWQIINKLATIATRKTFYKILKGEFRTNSYIKDKICKKLHGKARA